MVLFQGVVGERAAAENAPYVACDRMLHDGRTLEPRWVQYELKLSAGVNVVIFRYSHAVAPWG
jgi:hypothetical protein